MADILADIDNILKDLEHAYKEAERMKEGTLPTTKRRCRCEYRDYANGNHRKDCPERQTIEAARPKRWRY